MQHSLRRHQSARSDRGGGRCRRIGGDCGYATAEAEAEVALPALLVVLALAVGVVVSVGAQLRCVDAARVAARVVARGDSDAAAVRAAKQVAPREAWVLVPRHGTEVDVTVSADTRPFGAGVRLFPAVYVSAHAATEIEGP